MPTYAYTCTVCGHSFDVRQSFDDAPLTVCPECSGALRKVFSPVGVVFKGSGFYRTDARSSGGSGSGGTKDSDSSGSSGTTKESGSSGTKDSGSSAPAKDSSSGAKKSPGSSGAASGASSSTAKAATP